MNIIKPKAIILDEINGDKILNKIEQIGRVCYKSENNITKDSSKIFVKNIIKRGHESVIEHFNISVKVFCDRGVSHEIVRHRLASYSQESTRYCRYNKDKFNNELTFIKPVFWDEDDENYLIWKESMQNIENNYMKLLEKGATAEEARSILPNSLKTEIVITMNLRQWRHFFKLRIHKSSHPQMREVAKIILTLMKKNIEIIFDDL